jgi:hypothetical protein
MIVEVAKLDVTQYTVQYELLRFQVIGSAENVVLAGQPRGVGLALFLSEGMPGWLRTVETVLRTAPPLTRERLTPRILRRTKVHRKR